MFDRDAIERTRRLQAAWEANEALYAAHRNKPYAIAEWGLWGIDDPAFPELVLARGQRRIQIAVTVAVLSAFLVPAGTPAPIVETSAPPAEETPAPVLDTCGTGGDRSGTIVVVPTYNERDNIARLIDQVLARDGRLDVLVVDDGSPDGTGAIVDALKATNPRVDVIHRDRKLGLGTAYIAGFKWALARQYAFVFEMDADFSHDPAHLPQFLEAVAGADLVDVGGVEEDLHGSCS